MKKSIDFEDSLIAFAAAIGIVTLAILVGDMLGRAIKYGVDHVEIRWIDEAKNAKGHSIAAETESR